MDAAGSQQQSAAGLPTVAILASGGQAEALADGLRVQGLRPVPVALEETLDGRLVGRAQVLLVDLCEAPDELIDVLDRLTETASVPVLFNETELAGRPRAWLRRLARKLASLAVPDTAADAAPAQTPQPAARDYAGPMIWVLGASFGGPAAIKRFLDSMPESPPAAFILAQHIGNGFVDLLAAQLNRSTRFRVVAAADGMRPEPASIYVAPVDSRIRFDAAGRMALERVSDNSLYRPCIDKLMEEVARYFGPMAGAIVFSGMGDDGTQGVRAVAEAGGEVWAQDSASSTVASMPDCAAATGVVRRRGSPEALSAALVEYLQARESARAVQ